jgi:hypothetical protein
VQSGLSAAQAVEDRSANAEFFRRDLALAHSWGILRHMGKVTEFLEIDRRDRRYVPASDRIRSFKFMIPLSEEATKDQAARCMDCGIPFCHTGCPVDNQVPDFGTISSTGRIGRRLRAIFIRRIIFPNSPAAFARRHAMHAEH